MTVTPTGYQLPVPSTDLLGSVELEDRARFVSIHFKYFLSGERRRGSLTFDNVRAYRHRAEVHCTADQIESGYDQLVEVEESPWASELRRDTTAVWREYWLLRHFLIYFDSNGCFEVMAASWRAEEVLDR